MTVGLKDIAKATGYSISTVSYVLNNLEGCPASEATRQKILKAGRSLGYEPNYAARTLRHRRSRLIGVLGTVFGSEVASMQASAIGGILFSKGYQTHFVELASDPELAARGVQEMLRHQVEGLIVAANNAGKFFSPDTLPPQLPCVLMVKEDVPGVPCVIIDREEAVARAVLRLMELGHRRIGFFATLDGANDTKQRGYERAMKAAGIFCEELLFEVRHTGGERERILSRPADFRNVTALLTTNDAFGVEAFTALMRIGIRVPEDCSVIGFDDSALAASTTPTLTTLRQPREEASAEAVRLLFERMEGKEVKSVRFVPELVERESIGPCRKGE